MRKGLFMKSWQELMNGHVFITDLGQEHICEVEGEKQALGRYAVWSPLHGSESHSIVEIGSDLEGLMKKYKVSLHRVCIAARETTQITETQKGSETPCQSL